MQDNDTPLAGIRVLDLTRLLPGPFCTQLLADLGADVIKVEDPAGGDYLRYTPPLADDGTSILFHALNRGKRSITLNLKAESDRTHFLALCQDADVVVESFRPGVMARLGLGVEALHAVNPRLIVCAISGYGQSGPLRHRAGHDVNYVARAGAFALMKRPTLLPVQVADLAGGAWPAAMQICAALVGRATSGVGAFIDVDMCATVTGLLSLVFARASVGEAVDDGQDLLIGKVPCYGLYPTSDGHLAVGALEPKFWGALCSALERPDLLDCAYDTGDAGEGTREVLSTIFRSRSTEAWTAFFADVDACVEPVLAPDALLEALATIVVPLPAPADDTPARFVPLGLGIAGHRPRTEAAPALGAHNHLLLP